MLQWKKTHQSHNYYKDPTKAADMNMYGQSRRKHQPPSQEVY